MERLVRLLARSRKVELDVIASQFGPFIDADRLAQMRQTLRTLDASWKSRRSPSKSREWSSALIGASSPRAQLLTGTATFGALAQCWAGSSGRRVADSTTSCGRKLAATCPGALWSIHRRVAEGGHGALWPWFGPGHCVDCQFMRPMHVERWRPDSAICALGRSLGQTHSLDDRVAQPFGQDRDAAHCHGQDAWAEAV
jgi:hypothetical protein